MGFFKSLFGKPVDKVSSDVRQNSISVGLFLSKAHSNIVQYGDFTFQYLYTNSEPIAQGEIYGSVIHIRIESPVHESLYQLPIDTKTIQDSIDKHQNDFKSLPDNLSKDKTRWIYFNNGTKFRIA